MIEGSRERKELWKKDENERGKEIRKHGKIGGHK